MSCAKTIEMLFVLLTRVGPKTLLNGGPIRQGEGALLSSSH